MPSWKGKTRGGLLGYKIFIYILKKLGLTAAYLLLRFVAAYYIISAPAATGSIYKYFREIRRYGRWKAFSSIYKSYYVFGQTIIDKIAIASGMQDKFTYTYDGIENLDTLKEEGGVIISAHLGNWEIAGLLLTKVNLKTHVLVFEAEHEKIKQFLEQVMKDRSVHVIPMKQDFSHIFRVNTALKHKEVICMHGDRFLQGGRVKEKDFMGHPAKFPLGPFSIVSKLDVPYTFAYAMRGKGRKYHLSATPCRKEKDPEKILDQYVKHLETKLEPFPLQWFNYYDFWSEEVQGASIDTSNE